MANQTPPLTWLESGEPFPDVERAWGKESDAPGLLAAGGDLRVATLVRAYESGIFPWFSAGQPILWWSPDPRMVLQVDRFRLHRSLRKTLRKLQENPTFEIRIDTSFARVIEACAGSRRNHQSGTWIVPPMQAAYTKLFAAGHAHSVETWIDGELVGGLYCIALGKAVFGESMFTRIPDASKIALAALVGFCRHHGITMIDCQQNTAHLASLGAGEVSRATLLHHVACASRAPSVLWHFSPLYWEPLFRLPKSHP